jgi:spermidine/putrescine transport system ATP-binding protein
MPTKHVRRLSLTGVSKSYGTPEGGAVRALVDVDLAVEPGEFMVLLGPSGCGKTTLLRIVAGLEYPDVGEVHLGDDRIDVLPAYRRRVNTVFQSYALFPHLTVVENVRFGLDMDRTDRAIARARVEEMLQLVQLTGYGTRRPSQLSGGQQQRVALARALAKGPDVLLLDEPLSALDLKLRRGMQVELKRIQDATGVTFVFVTHDQDEAMSLGHRIAVFEHGRIAQLGTPREIYERPRTRYVADFIGESTFLAATAEGSGTAVGYRLTGGDVLPHHAVDHNGDGPPPAGTGVCLAVRPEHLSFAGDASGAPGDTAAVQAVVRDVSYGGRDVRVTALADDSTPVVVRVPARGVPVPEPGDKVRIAVRPGMARLVRG